MDTFETLSFLRRFLKKSQKAFFYGGIYFAHRQNHFSHRQYCFTHPQNHFSHRQYCFAHLQNCFSHQQYCFAYPQNHFSHRQYCFAHPQNHFSHRRNDSGDSHSLGTDPPDEWMEWKRQWGPLSGKVLKQQSGGDPEKIKKLSRKYRLSRK